MKKAIIIMAIFLSSCGPKLDLGQFEPLVKEFQAEGQKRLGIEIKINTLIIKRAELKDNNGDTVEGQCVMGPFMTPTIFVNRLTWPYMDAYQQRAVLFHELGHCVLLRDHKDTYDAFGWPTSIMNTYVIWGYFNNLTYNRYMDELFLER